MKILINGYLQALPKGKETFSGPRNFLAEFLGYLDKSEHQYTCMVLRGKKQNNNRFSTTRFRTVKQNSWLVAQLRLHTNDVMQARKPGYPKSLEEPKKILMRIIEKEKPDLVIIQGMSIANWYLLEAARALKIPTIYTHLGLWYKEIPAYNRSTKAGIKIMNEMERDMTRYCTKEVFLTPLSYQHYTKQLIEVDKKKLEILPLPYEDWFVNKKLPALPKGKTIKVGIVGRWDPIKNHETVLALAKLAQKQNRRMEFYAVTNIRTDYPWYESLRDDYPKFIHVIPPMKPEKLKRFYKQMHVFILPSHFDVSPGVVPEAALQNRLTIISPTVGWVSAYKSLGMATYISNFKNLTRTLDVIESASKKTPPKRWLNHLLKKHHPKIIFDRYMTLAKSAINV